MHFSYGGEVPRRSRIEVQDHGDRLHPHCTDTGYCYDNLPGTFTRMISHNPSGRDRPCLHCAKDGVGFEQGFTSRAVTNPCIPKPCSTTIIPDKRYSTDIFCPGTGTFFFNHHF
jgi:hypothetical protein